MSGAYGILSSARDRATGKVVTVPVADLDAVLRHYVPLSTECAELKVAARQSLHWFEEEQQAGDEDCGDPGCRECEGITRPRQRLIDALRQALGGEK